MTKWNRNDEDYYLSSLALFNVRMNILVEFLEVFQVCKSSSQLDSTSNIYSKKFPKTRPNSPPTFTCLSLKAHVHLCIHILPCLSCSTVTFEDCVWGPLISHVLRPSRTSYLSKLDLPWAITTLCSMVRFGIPNNLLKSCGISLWFDIDLFPFSIEFITQISTLFHIVELPLSFVSFGLIFMTPWFPNGNHPSVISSSFGIFSPNN